MANYSLQSEELNKINSLFTEYVEGIRMAVLKIFENYGTTLSKISYEPLYLHAAKLVEHYNVATIQTIKRACDEWAQNGENFVKTATRYHVGQDAEQCAGVSQQALLDEIEALMMAQDPLQNVVTNAEAHFTLADFTDLSDAVTQSVVQLEEAKNARMSDFEKLREDNIAAAGIHIVAKTIGETVYSEFSEITKKALDDLKSTLEAAGKATESSLEDGVDNTPTSTVASLEQQRTELMNQISDIFSDDNL